MGICIICGILGLAVGIYLSVKKEEGMFILGGLVVGMVLGLILMKGILPKVVDVNTLITVDETFQVPLQQIKGENSYAKKDNNYYYYQVGGLLKKVEIDSCTVDASSTYTENYAINTKMKFKSPLYGFLFSPFYKAETLIELHLVKPE